MFILTEKDLVSLLSTFPAGKRGIGGGLTVRKQDGIENGGVYFKGIYRSSDGRQKEIHLGTYGKGVGQLNLKQARQKWDELKAWAKTHEKDPADYSKEKKQDELSQKSFAEAIDEFLSVKKKQIKDTTFHEYQLKLNNQILPRIGNTTSLKELEWTNGGRKKVMDAVNEISSGGKYDLANRCQSLMRQVFNLSISRGWMLPGRNPADKMNGDPEPSNKHHPSIKWEEVPALLKEVNLNRCNTHIQSVLATKMMLMTFLRAGSLARLEWEWFESQFPNTITIPGTTTGLKRKHNINDDKPHHVPITSEMREVFDVLRQFSGDSKYVFQPMRDSRFPHLDPSAINNYLRNLGYKDKLRAHGWRSTALTTGIDVLKCESDVIRKQMGHLPEGKVSQAYDNSLRLEERRVFMEKWCQLLVESGLKV